MYYLIEISTTNEGVAKAIWDRETLDLATMQLHQTLASAMANENVQSCLCMVINSKGDTQRYDYWERTNELS